MIPGEITGPDGTIELNVGRPRIDASTVVNGGDRPVQVGSHYHFAEANPALPFDRGAARGQRLDIAAGTSVRFEPGIERDGLARADRRRPHHRRPARRGRRSRSMVEICASALPPPATGRRPATASGSPTPTC